jgi:hypothetical protein
MTTDTKYNGWTNYETWVVSLWLDNDQCSQEFWQEQARDAVQEAIDNDESDPREEAISTIAQRLESEHDEGVPEVPGVFADLLNSALGRVEWRDIARNMIDEVEIFAAGWNTPGRMPDNPPALFTDCDSARLHISEAMDREAEAREDDTEDEMYSAATAALEAASLECLKGSGEYGQTIGAYHYFVTKV